MKDVVWATVGVIAAICMLAIVAVAYFLGPCAGTIERADGGDPVAMKCCWAYVAVTVASVVGAVVAVCAAVAKTKEGRRLSALALAAVSVGVIVVLSPIGIGVCAADGMPCAQHSMFVYVLAAIDVVVALVMAAMADPRRAELPKMGL